MMKKKLLPYSTLTDFTFFYEVEYMQSLRIQSSTPGKIARPLDKLIGPELKAITFERRQNHFLHIPNDVVVQFEVN